MTRKASRKSEASVWPPPFHGGGRDSNSLGGIFYASPSEPDPESVSTKPLKPESPPLLDFEIEKNHKNSNLKPKKAAKVEPNSNLKISRNHGLFSDFGTQKSNLLQDWLSVGEVADRLGITTKTVRQWCLNGTLPCVAQSYGSKTTYLINVLVVESFRLRMSQHPVELAHEIKPKQKTKKNSAISHADMVSKWVVWMSRGLVNGKVFSPRTINDYESYANRFFKDYRALSLDTMEAELLRIPPEQYAKRDKFYKAMVCFAKYLIKKEHLELDFLTKVQSLKPKRHLPPKRHSVDDIGLESLLKACGCPLDRLIVILLYSTGLRASEACSLRFSDIDLEKAILTVQLGKGNKTRRVGLAPITIETIKAYLASVEVSLNAQDYVFINRFGEPMDRHGLHRRLKRIGQKAGVKVSPHCLRRAFVTLNANKGRSLVMLQMACGHSDIKTTRSYCMTSEQEVIDAMKQWE